jgi:hypothetical protein
MTLKPRPLLLGVFLGIMPMQRVTGAPIAAAPAFAIQLEGGTLKQYRPAPSAGISDDVVDATVARVDGDEWELTLKLKRGPISKVWFPWQPDRSTAMPRPDAAVVYYPSLLGVAVRGSLLSEWGWEGSDYPGGCFAPLVVVADDADAQMVAAANWPPRRVSPRYSLGRIGLLYDERLPAGGQRSYRALIVQTTRSSDERPWQRALDEYKIWLKGHVRTAALEPAPPPWMQSMHGWLNVQLQNMPTWNATVVEAMWERWKAQFSWVQFWGQMSDYFDPNRHAANEVGCCLESSAVHTRYQPDLLRVTREIAREGHVGFYARPRAPYAPLVGPGDGGTTQDLTFLRDWLERNRFTYGANAFYIDVLGHRYFGDPLRVATLLKNTIDPATIIEFPVDVYPTGFLVSGSLGGGSWQGGPGRTTAQLDSALTRTTFPSFGRYLLDDRVLLLGESNGDGRWWGKAADYWTERQAFLLGAKFDAIHPTENGKPDGPEDQALALAIAARDKTGWWRRNPAYLDQRGLANLPADIDVRRYRGRDGEDLLVVDNWHGRRDLMVTMDGASVALPDDRLAIVIVPKTS